MSNSDWQVSDRFAEFSTPWFKLIGEQIQTDNQTLDYWRVEKADSVIILPIQDQYILCPPVSYRPGVGVKTLDFPGGRCPQSQNRQEIAQRILQRELGVDEEIIQGLAPLNQEGWLVNSSFSDQKLYGFVAHLHDGDVSNLGKAYPIDTMGLNQLLTDLTCLQCRSLLLAWWRSHSAAFGDRNAPSQNAE